MQLMKPVTLTPMLILTLTRFKMYHLNNTIYKSSQKQNRKSEKSENNKNQKTKEKIFVIFSYLAKKIEMVCSIFYG